MIARICRCGKRFETQLCYIKRGGGKYCSQKCAKLYLIGIKRTLWHRERIRLSKLAENNPMWRGNKVGLDALHDWVKRRLLKPELCQRCGIKPPYDLANKGVYNRDLINWEWLCRKCHMLEDDRLKKLHARVIPKKERQGMSERMKQRWEAGKVDFSKRNSSANVKKGWITRRLKLQV